MRLRPTALAVLTVLGRMATTFAADDAKPAPKLDAGSVWKGTCSVDERRANGKTHKATLKIVSRDGNHVVGTFMVNRPKNPLSVKIEGTIKPGGDVVFRPLEHDANQPAGLEYPGHVDGDHLTFKMLRAADQNAQGPDVDLTCKKDKRD